MAYQNRYRLADDMIAHLDTVISEISDPFIISRYVGFVAVAAVTVYELAIKDIFIDFAERKHSIFGTFARNYFDHINGRIKIENLCADYLRKFGGEYEKKFKEKVKKSETDNLRIRKVNVRSSYDNVILWRHKFAHEGEIPNVTYIEITHSYQDGKEIIKCLAETMRSDSKK